MAGSQVPTLSQVQTSDTEHLREAATQWSFTAAVWNEAFTQLSAQMSYPGGSSWEGAAAEAAQHQAKADRLAVTSLADKLQDASAVARAGKRDIDAARQSLLAAVSAAEGAGFVVGEDFSVTSRGSVSAARQAEAQAMAAEIRIRIANLIATEQEVAATITAAASGIDDVRINDGSDDQPTVQLVDNRIVREAPPLPEPPEPPPGPMPPIDGADDIRRVLDPLQNGGKRGPNGVGTKPGVVEAWDTGAMKRMWDYLTRNATDADAGPGYSGPVRVLPDGTKIGLRQSAKGWDDTIDVWYPDGTNGTKVHTPYAPYFPSIGAPPQLPPVGDPGPVPVAPPQTWHAPVAMPPSDIFEPNGLPPWLIDPSTPGFHAPVQAPTIMPGVGLPDASTAPITAPATRDFLPDLGDDIIEAGRTAGAGVLAGVAIIGGLLAEGLTPSGQLAR